MANTSSQGTVSVPVEILHECGLQPGDEVDIFADGASVRIEGHPVASKESWSMIEDRIDQQDQKVAEGRALMFDSVGALKEYLDAGE